MKRVVVLGAGYAGLPTLNRIARQTHRDEVELVLVSTQDGFVERPRLHQVATGQRRRELPLADMVKRGVRLQVGHVDRLDAGNRVLHFDEPEGTPDLDYDLLVYGPGSNIDLGIVPGVEEHAATVTDPGAARRIADALKFHGRQRVVVCGGGLTGLELASEVADAHPAMEVTLATRGALGDWLSPKAREYVGRSLQDLGVTVRDHTTITGVTKDSVQTASGDDLPFHLCLWAGGFAVPELATEAGVAVDATGRAITDRTMRSVSHREIFVVGDAAAVPGPWGPALAMGCRTGGFTAPAAADAVVADLAGRKAPELRFRYIHECISLGRHHAVIQFLDRDGAAKNRVLRGRLARTYKNVVLDSARWVFKHPGPMLPRRRHLTTNVAALAPGLRRTA